MRRGDAQLSLYARVHRRPRALLQLRRCLPQRRDARTALRDQDGREVDFVVLESEVPRVAIECKLSASPVDKNLLYFKNKFPDCEAWQIHARGTKDYYDPRGIRVAPALEYLRTLV